MRTKKGRREAEERQDRRNIGEDERRKRGRGKEEWDNKKSGRKQKGGKEDERKIRKDGTKTGGRGEQESTTRRGKNAEMRK